MLATISISGSRASHKAILTFVSLCSPLIVGLFLVCILGAFLGSLAILGVAFNLLCFLGSHAPVSLFVLPCMGMARTCIKGVYHAI